jgi:hypothetical protein
MTVRRALPVAAAALCAAAVWPAAGAAAPHARDFTAAVPVSAGAAAAAVGRESITTPPLRAPHAFDLLGFRWRAPAHAALHVRVREGHGGWSRWTVAGDAAAHGAPRASDPVWTGRSRVYQVRTSRPLAGLRAHFVRVPRRHLAATVASARRITARGAPHIIPRSAWDPDHDCDPTHSAGYGRVDMAFVHHTVNANDYGPDDSAGIVLAMCRYHERSNGWWDLGYNFVVDRYGQIFEGRAGGVTRAVVGAQAQGYNSVSTGVANIGTFTTEGQTAAGLRAVGKLIGWKLTLHGVPVEGRLTEVSGGGPLNSYPSGTRVRFHRISGHRDGDATECPGDALYGQLPQIRRLAAAAAEHSEDQPVLTASARPAISRYRGRVTFTGDLSLPGEAPAGGRTVILERSGRGGWVDVDRATTDRDGHWSATQRPRVNGQFRASWAGEGGEDGVRSSTVTLLVRRKLSIDAEQAHVPVGRSVALSGTVTPTRRAVWVRAARRLRGGGYVPTYHWRVPSGDGTWSLRVRLHRRALYRFVVRARPDPHHAAGTARTYVRAVTAEAGHVGGAGSGSGGGGSSAGGATPG